jgi:hypothetical protein
MQLLSALRCARLSALVVGVELVTVVKAHPARHHRARELGVMSEFSREPHVATIAVARLNLGGDEIVLSSSALVSIRALGDAG